jgi:hypothetical protein
MRATVAKMLTGKAINPMSIIPRARTISMVQAPRSVRSEY